MEKLVSLVLLLLALSHHRFIAEAIAPLSQNNSFTLTILHTNDVHSRFMQISKYGGACSSTQEDKNHCYGGFARLHHKVKEIRNSHRNVIYLSAGDYFQGTVWYTLNKWRVVSHFVNQLNHTAMALGNHEFDDGIEGLLPFLEAATFPILSCNINDTDEPNIQKKYNKSIVVEYEGRKVGIIGYTTIETPTISIPGLLKFEDEIHAIAVEAAKLDSQGVEILIAVGHSGIEVDLKIAKSVQHIDLVIGGHTNTFLYTGTPPDIERPIGPYPTIVTQTNGRRIPVVQAYAFGKYLGYLNITFNKNGEVTGWNGNPILLDSSVPQDPDMLKDLKIWNLNVSLSVKEEIGKTHVFLNGSSLACRSGECNLGNLIADAMVHSFQNFHADGDNSGQHIQWTEVALGVISGGGIRSSIDESSNNGSITLEDILTILPFQNTVDLIEIKGKYLQEAFEHGVDGFDPNGSHLHGKFLQQSGIRIVYDMRQPIGRKVREMMVLCTECRIPHYVPLESSTVYKVVISAYNADGGDGFTVVKENTIARHNLGILDTDMLINYIKANSPITQGIEGRISFYDPSLCQSEEKSDTALPLLCNLNLIVLLLALKYLF